MQSSLAKWAAGIDFFIFYFLPVLGLMPPAWGGEVFDFLCRRLCPWFWSGQGGSELSLGLGRDGAVLGTGQGRLGWHSCDRRQVTSHLFLSQHSHPQWVEYTPEGGEDYVVTHNKDSGDLRDCSMLWLPSVITTSTPGPFSLSLRGFLGDTLTPFPFYEWLFYTMWQDRFWWFKKYIFPKGKKRWEARGEGSGGMWRLLAPGSREAG